MHQQSSSKKRFFFLLYIVVLLILGYAIQDFQTSRNVTAVEGLDRKGVHIALFVILSVLSLYYFFSTILGKIVISSVNVALWLITIWVFYVNVAQSAMNWSVFVHMGLTCLWILVHHFFSSYLRRFPEALPKIKKCFAVLFLFYAFSAFYAAFNIQQTVKHIAVVNLSYGVLVFLPWISIVSRKWLRRAGIGIVFLVVIISMKRGAIIVFPLMLSSWMLVDAMVQKKGIGKPLFTIFFMMVLFLVGLFTIDYLSDGFLMKRFSPEQLASGSGRAQAFSFAIGEISGRSFWVMLLGYGSGASLKYFGTGVHNEWLEFLFSFGVVGGVLYAFLFLALAWQIFKLIRMLSPYAAAYTMAVVYMLVVGMFGGIYFVHSTLFVVALFGAVEGLMFHELRISKDFDSNQNITVNQGAML